MKIYIECQSLDYSLGVVKAQVDEAVNQVTMIDLELASDVELLQDDIDAASGQAITLYVEDIINNTMHKIRWDGFIFEFINITTSGADNGIFYYTMVMRPKLWNLNYSANCHSYPEMSRIDVLEDLLLSHGFKRDIHFDTKYFNEDLYPAFNQLLQTGNSDLSFFKNLTINAGINYYFSCDDEGQEEEVLHLLDDNAFFPDFEDEIPIERSVGLLRKERSIHEISRLTRVVPKEIAVTAFLSDGSTRPKVSSVSVYEGNIDSTVEMFIPEGHTDSDKSARQAGKVVSAGFLASRVMYQGVCNHVRIRPCRRVSLSDGGTLEEYKVLVIKTHHSFEQSVLAALSGNGSSNVEYKNYFLAVEPDAPVRPTETWTDVDTDMVLDSAMDLDPDGKAGISPKFKFCSKLHFNTDNDPEKNTAGIKELMATVTMLQAQIKTLRNKVSALESAQFANGSGLITAEITKNAWVTQGKELVCMVKAEEFEDPIVVKVAVAWHDKGGGMLHLPRKGNHVWLQRVHRSKGNDWVLIGYRPTGTVAASNDPANSFTVKKIN